MTSPHDLIHVPQAEGHLSIARGVLLDIVAREVESAPGVAALGAPPPARPRLAARLLAWFGALLGAWRTPRPRGVEIDLGDGEVAVALEVVARRDVDLTAMAATLRERVTWAIESATALEVRCVDVAVVALAPGAAGRPALDPSSELRRRIGLEVALDVPSPAPPSPPRPDERRRRSTGDSR